MEAKPLHFSRKFLKVAREIFKAALGRPFCVLLTILVRRTGIIPKHMIKAQTLHCPQLMTPIKGSLIDTDPDIIQAVHNNLSVDRYT